MKKKLFDEMTSGFPKVVITPSPKSIRLLRSHKSTGSQEWDYVPGAEEEIDCTDGFPATHVAIYKLFRVQIIKKKGRRK